MGSIAGVDGCRGGWVAAFRNLATDQVVCELFKSFAEVLDDDLRPSVVAVDMPIGLAEAGDRECDRQARRLLGPRRSSVFPPPIRPVLQERGYPEANALSKRLNGVGLSRQAYGLMPKIGEVDREVRARPHGRIREAHPELAFMAMNGGGPMGRPKRERAGLAERRQLLKREYGPELNEMESTAARLPGVGLDDLYDALALLRTARRLILGQASRIPEPPPLDRLGIPMEITY